MLSKDNEYRIKSTISGFASGAATQFVLHPIDSIKTRLQAQGRGERAHVGVRASYRSLSHILQQEGWRALYQGVGPASFAGSLSWGLYFTVYNSSKTAYARMYFGGSGSGGSGGSANGAGGSANGSGSAGGENRKEDIPSVYLLLAGLKAGVATLAVTHPLWLIKLRMQLQQRNLSSSSSSDTAHLTCYRNTFDGFKQIVQKEGFKGLYVGIVPALWLTSHGAIHFVSYDKLKSFYTRSFSPRNSSAQLNPAESLIIGGVTKILAAVVTYPLQVIKTRLQDERNKYGKIRYSGMIDAIHQMFKMEGVGAFFRGIIPHALRVTPQAAVTLMLYEQVMKTLNNVTPEEFFE